MGDTSYAATSSRLDLKQAKKERRQRQKDGDVDEAFADNDMGKSCEDEGMQEILVAIPISLTLPAMEAYDPDCDAWASPMLGSRGARCSQTSLSKKSDLRRGKRDLMRSWLATPISGEGSIATFPPVLPSTPRTSTPSGIPNCTDEAPGKRTPSVVSTADLEGSMGSAISYLFSFSTCTWDENPLSHSTSSGGWHGSARQSRPRDALHSIKAYRKIESEDEDDAPNLAPVTALLDVSSKRNASSFESSMSMSTVAVDSLSVYLGSVSSPHHHQCVTFNGDAYNLDAWDSAVLGPFALTTESCAVPPRVYESNECTPDTGDSTILSSSPVLPVFVGIPLHNSPQNYKLPQSQPLHHHTAIPVFENSASNTTSETQEYPPHHTTSLHIATIINCGWQPELASHFGRSRRHPNHHGWQFGVE